MSLRTLSILVAAAAALPLAASAQGHVAKPAAAPAVASAPMAAGHAVTISDAWVRATVAGQTATGAFLTIRVPAAARLVSASSPVAGHVELHEMVLQDNVMKMREAKDGIALAAGQPVKLAPGGLHVMLMDLKAPVATGAKVPLELTVQHADGRRQVLKVQAVGKPLNEAAPKH